MSTTVETAVVKPGTFRRKYSGSAKWHMSREAVSLSVTDVMKWSKYRCVSELVEARWGGWKSVQCPHCGTAGNHYWRKTELRWKCSGCGSTFSVTSKTVFAGHQLSLQQIILAVLTFVNSAAGQAALELKRHLNVTYNTAYTLEQKMREGFVRGYNVGLLNGDIEMDGAHQSGHKSNEKRGKPQGSAWKDASLMTDDEKRSTMLTQTGREKARKKARAAGGAFDQEFRRQLPKGRRMLLTVVARSNQRGKGSRATRVAVGLVETAPVVRSVMDSFIACPESYLNTDTSPAYIELGARFMQHRQVEHSKTLIGPKGENNNQAESLNWRMDRAERGTHLNIEEKYLLDYGAEVAFRSDTRRLPNGTQMSMAFNVAMSVGQSLFWRGFTHGHHREVELTHPLPLAAKASGPKKGSHPFRPETLPH